MKIDKKQLALIEELSNAKAPSGFEDEVVEIVKREAKSFKVEEDKLRNVYLYRKKHSGKKPVLMLDAHSDEVGFMVHSIRPNGTLRVVNIGGWKNSILQAEKMLVRNADGKWISAIFAAKPKHFGTSPDNGQMPISDLSLDIGATSKQEAIDTFHIRIGEPIVPATKFEFDEENGLMFGKAFDDRIGVACVLEVMKQIDKLDLDIDVVGVISSQEEVGERGAKVSVNHVKPDLAYCLEGCPADDTFTEEYAIQTRLKKGPMFRHMDISVICSPRFQRFILDLASKKKMLVQESVREGGGNDAAVISTSALGSAAVTAGVPVRYIHAVNCIASYQDYEATVKLTIEVIKNLNKKVVDQF